MRDWHVSCCCFEVVPRSLREVLAVLRGMINRTVGAVLLALFIIAVGGCGTGGQTPLTRADTATVSGKVINAETGLPLLDARVRIGSIVVHVDQAGGFIAVVPVGTVERSVTADGYTPVSDNITVTAGDNDLGAVRMFELPPPPPQF